MRLLLRWEPLHADEWIMWPVIVKEEWGLPCWNCEHKDLFSGLYFFLFDLCSLASLTENAHIFFKGVILFCFCFFNWLWMKKKFHQNSDMVWLQGRVLHDSVHMDRQLCLYIYFNASRDVFLAARVGVCCFAAVHLVEEVQIFSFFCVLLLELCINSVGWASAAFRIAPNSRNATPLQSLIWNFEKKKRKNLKPTQEPGTREAPPNWAAAISVDLSRIASKLFPKMYDDSNARRCSSK